MRTIVRTIGLVIALLALAVVVDQITPLQRLTLYLARHPEPYTTIAIGASILGWALMAGAWAYGWWTRGRPMSGEGARRFAGPGAGQPSFAGRFRGRAAGREFGIEVSFRQVKVAARTGAWWRDPGWRPVFIGLLALPLIVYGMFGYFIVVGSPLVKILCGGAVLYATVRTLRGFWIA